MINRIFPPDDEDDIYCKLDPQPQVWRRRPTFGERLWEILCFVAVAALAAGAVTWAIAAPLIVIILLWR